MWRLGRRTGVSAASQAVILQAFHDLRHLLVAAHSLAPGQHDSGEVFGFLFTPEKVSTSPATVSGRRPQRILAGEGAGLAIGHQAIELRRCAISPCRRERPRSMRKPACSS